MKCPAVLLLALLCICRGCWVPCEKSKLLKKEKLHKTLTFWRALEGLVAGSSSRQGCLL